MKRVIKELNNTGIQLYCAKDSAKKVELSRQEAILAAKYLKLYCDWKRTFDCQRCPFLKSPDGYCILHEGKPDAWEIPEIFEKSRNSF